MSIDSPLLERHWRAGVPFLHIAQVESLQGKSDIHQKRPNTAWRCMEMLSFLRTGCLSVCLLCFAPVAGGAEGNEEDLLRHWVDYRDGAISVAFSQVPVEFAVHAIHARTGLQIIVPRRVYGRTLNLRLRELPLESAMRSLVFSIGFSSFALTYDTNGRPVRAIVLEAPPPAADKPAEPRGLTAREQEELNASLKTWNDLKPDARERIETRLRALPPSEDRDELLKEYGRRLLGIAE
jgi:hypothetical protein